MAKKRSKKTSPSVKGDKPKGAAKTSSSPDSRSVGKRADARNRWTFLTNHSHVLIVIYAESGLVLREIAARVGITERAIQQILIDLEEGGFIQRERVGRRNEYRVLTDKPLRHPIEAHCSISDLLSLIVDHPDAPQKNST